jgi:hypothetical protein
MLAFIRLPTEPCIVRQYQVLYFIADKITSRSKYYLVDRHVVWACLPFGERRNEFDSTGTMLLGYRYRPNCQRHVSIQFS